jgi:glyoxylase I family protein
MRVHHIAFRTHDLERARRFYVDAIGLRELSQQRRSDGSTRAIWMSLDGVVLMLESSDPAEPGPVPGGMDMVAFAIDEGARAAIRTRLALASVPIDAETQFTLYVRDPDGRRIGLSSYPFPPSS